MYCFRAWRHCLVSKSPGSFFREPRSNFQNPHGSLQASVTPVPGNSMFSSGLLEYFIHMVYMHTVKYLLKIKYCFNYNNMVNNCLKSWLSWKIWEVWVWQKLNIASLYILLSIPYVLLADCTSKVFFTVWCVLLGIWTL